MKQLYQPPHITTVQFAIEQGFSASDPYEQPIILWIDNSSIYDDRVNDEPFERPTAESNYDFFGE